MIRTLAAIAALAALPTLAAAQSYSDDSGFTVRGHRPDTYSIVINVAGKSPRQVHREIWDAAYTACERAPSTGNIMDDRPAAMQACVTQAEWDASAQYRDIQQGWSY